MIKSIKRIGSYLLPLGLSLFLLHYTFRNVPLADLGAHIHTLRVGWLGVTTLLGLCSHLLRAYRLRLLVVSLGFNISLVQSFMSLMVGYMSNLLLPRLGNVVHLGLVSKLGGIPMGTVLGIFIMERLMDLVGFLVIVVLTCFFCWPQLQKMFQYLPILSLTPTTVRYTVGLGIVLASIMGGILYHVYKRDKFFYLKSFLMHVKEGLRAFQLSKHKLLIIVVLALKWVVYCIGDYVGIFSIETASHLEGHISLAVLTMSTLSFAMPVQGGMGAYHILVSAVLVAYGIREQHALLYATCIHATHILSIVVVGLIGLWTTQRALKNRL
jgi:uncharacterized protein (TIRG00374 family)